MMSNANEKLIEQLVREKREALDSAFAEALREKPDRDVVGLMLVLRNETRIYVMDHGQHAALVESLRTNDSESEFWRFLREECEDVFTAAARDSEERVLVGQPSTGLVSRLRYRTQVRRDARIAIVEGRASQVVLPPKLTSATNMESMLMGAAWFFAPYNLPDSQDESMEEAMATPGSQANKLKSKLLELAKAGGWGSMLGFGLLWMECSFARLEVGHKLAAALCLTDIPSDVTVRAPWAHWVLVVPDGLLMDLARIWCSGHRAEAFVSRDGRVFNGDTKDLGGRAVLAAAVNLVRGCCLALSNPDDFRKEGQHGPTARASHKSNRSGPPDLQQARFLLSAPVKVDLREHLAASLSGRKGASPTVQFLVRGHWRNQAHGPKASLRKTIWIQPFWKGPEESRILLRQHRVED